MFTTMFMLLSGTLVVIKLAANCYKKLFPSPVFLATNFSVAFFGWIKNDVMKEKRFSGKFSCCRSFSSLEIVSKLARTVRVGEMRCVAMWCVGEEMLRGGEETSTDESRRHPWLNISRNESLMGWKRCYGSEVCCRG
jgi:hypothetical protein